MIEEQSKLRSPSFLRSDGLTLENPNRKIYKEKPDIETPDWTRALKWDDKQFKIIKFTKTGSLYCTTDSDKHLDKQKCKNYFSYIENIKAETSFDILITKTDEIKVVKFNDEVWENSECSCRWWHKDLKCRHITALACRLKKASYLEVAYSAPLTSKRKPGRPPLTASSLQRQRNELQEEEGVQLPSEDDDDDMPLRLSVSPASSQPGTSAVVEEPKKKRGR